MEKNRRVNHIGVLLVSTSSFLHLGVLHLFASRLFGWKLFSLRVQTKSLLTLEVLTLAGQTTHTHTCVHTDIHLCSLSCVCHACMCRTQRMCLKWLCRRMCCSTREGAAASRQVPTHPPACTHKAFTRVPYVCMYVCSWLQ